MCLTEYEQSLIQSLYDYSRVPLWILDENLKLFCGFFEEPSPGIRRSLSSHIEQTAAQIKHPGFDILCCENELYYIFSFRRSGRTFYTAGGPILLAGFCPPLAMRFLTFAQNMNTRELESLIVTLPVMTMASFSSILRLTMLSFGSVSVSIEEINSSIDVNLQNKLKHGLAHDLFENRSDFRIHTPYSEELAILNCVKEGNTAKLEAAFKALPETKYGNMSRNPVRQLFYGCIAATTLVTRYAIEGGLDEETAFTLSDVYIRQMENCKTLYELNILNEKMAVDFTEQVAKSKAARQPVYTEPVVKCIDCILMNIQQKITLETLSRLTNLTPKYISRLFKTETGQTLSEFIEKSRIDEAKNLLLYSQYSYSQISEYLSFNSHSYFISVFKRKVGMTPRAFRLRYSQSPWEISRS